MECKPPWVRPFDGELFTLWLARVAIQGGTDPLVLTGHIWPNWRMWTQDADRGLTSERLETIAAWFEFPKPLIEATTLRAMAKVMQGAAFPMQSTWPWIVSLGSRNRLRKAGLPFCPQCLADTAQPYFRLEWRLAWAIGCAQHRVRLMDHCPNCNAAIEPHRSTSSSQHLAHCIVCRFDLRGTDSPAVDEDALYFQSLATQVMKTRAGLLGGVEVPDTAWFQRMRSLIASPHCQLSSMDSHAMGRRDIGMCIEVQGPQEREFRLRNMVRWMRRNPDDFTPKQHTSRLSAEADVNRISTEKCRRRAKPKPPIQRRKVQQDWARWLRKHRIW